MAEKLCSLKKCGGGKSKETDWMYVRMEPQSTGGGPKNVANTRLMLYTKGYTIIRCKNNYSGSSTRALAVLTANVRGDTNQVIDDSETIIGTMNSTTAVDINITGNDYVWLAINNPKVGDPVSVWYKLVP